MRKTVATFSQHALTLNEKPPLSGGFSPEAASAQAESKGLLFPAKPPRQRWAGIDAER